MVCTDDKVAPVHDFERSAPKTSSSDAPLSQDCGAEVFGGSCDVIFFSNSLIFVFFEAALGLNFGENLHPATRIRSNPCLCSPIFATHEQV